MRLTKFRRVPKDRRYLERVMPSFCILDWRVVRFMPSLAAAPAGPPMTQSQSRRAFRI